MSDAVGGVMVGERDEPERRPMSDRCMVMHFMP